MDPKGEPVNAATDNNEALDGTADTGLPLATATHDSRAEEADAG